jgi:hypothetical protein
VPTSAGSPTAWTAESHVFTSVTGGAALRQQGLRVLDTCLSGAWAHHYPRDPSADLRVLNRDVVSLHYDAEVHVGLGRIFAHQYRRRIRSSVDLFWCSFLGYLPVVFEPAGRPVLWNMAFRWEGPLWSGGSNAADLWQRLQAMRATGQLRVTAANGYDQAYYEHFSGERVPIVALLPDYLPPWRDVPNAPVLIGPRKQNAAGERRSRQIAAALEPDVAVTTMAEAFPAGFTYDQISAARAIVLVPYSTYSGAITEWLTAGVPVLAPTPELLARWHLDDYLLDERKSAREPDVGAGRGCAGAPDPNLDSDPESLRHWLRFCDWYRWPVIRFDSLDELRSHLLDLDPVGASRALSEFTTAERARSEAALAAELAAAGLLPDAVTATP